MESLPIRERGITVAFLLCGVFLFAVSFWTRDSVRFERVLAEVAWGAPYFLVVARRHKRKAPTPTRGGIVRYEDGHKYKVAYALLYLWGLAFLLGAVGVTLFPASR